MTDLVIGAGYNLTWDQCRVWAKSLVDSGFDGDKILVYFGNNPALFEKLKEHGFKVAIFPSLTAAHNVCVTRFGAYHALLLNSPNKYNWVIATDVTDVVFQDNPMNFIQIEEEFGVNHLASSENLRYNQEAWGKNNLILSFGEDQYKILHDSTIYNAGVIAAKQDRMIDICNLVFQLSFTRLQHVFGGGGPDQAAYNLLLNTLTMNEHTAYLEHDVAWACQCGTTMDPARPQYHDIGKDKPPTFNGEYVINSRGAPYTIVHQYNRVPQLKEYYERKY